MSKKQKFTRQAIVTRYHGPGNVRGSRISAKAAAGRIFVEYDASLNIEENHRRAAYAFARKFEWSGEWWGGGLSDGGYCWVNVEP